MIMTQAIGLGIIISFLFTEITGLSAGLIVPGYLAFFFNNPHRIVITFLVAILSYCLVIILSRFIIIYSRRRFMATVLSAYLISWIFEIYLLKFISLENDLRVVGYIIPGLIANNMITQGVFKTILITLIVTFISRMLLLLFI